MTSRTFRTHACPDCGHQVKHDGDLDAPIEHLPDGRHKYTVTIHISTGPRPTFR